MKSSRPRHPEQFEYTPVFRSLCGLHGCDRLVRLELIRNRYSFPFRYPYIAQATQFSDTEHLVLSGGAKSPHSCIFEPGFEKRSLRPYLRIHGVQKNPQSPSEFCRVLHLAFPDSQNAPTLSFEL